MLASLVCHSYAASSQRAVFFPFTCKSIRLFDHCQNVKRCFTNVKIKSVEQLLFKKMFVIYSSLSYVAISCVLGHSTPLKEKPVIMEHKYKMLYIFNNILNNTMWLGRLACSNSSVGERTDVLRKLTCRVTMFSHEQYKQFSRKVVSCTSSLPSSNSTSRHASSNVTENHPTDIFVCLYQLRNSPAHPWY